MKMKKFLLMWMLMLGLTFIYNPNTNYGFVYLNNSSDNYVIIVDENMNVLRYYKGIVSGEERLDHGMDKWLKDKMDKGLPFRGVIVPFQQQQQKRLR